ncbi:hypothetical protein GGD65_003051 [Bradyrhizobium sp. CIR18]|nr:hypothetical protein [Bradyrhizobium sp. CIR18]
MDFVRAAGLLGLSRLRERPKRSQSAAGEGCHHSGTSSAILNNPNAETAPTPALPRKREREPTANAAASCTPYAIALLSWREGKRESQRLRT